MVITLGPELEAALCELARRQGIAPEEVALGALRERFLPSTAPIEPRDEWERRLSDVAIDCGVSLSDAALSRDRTTYPQDAHFRPDAVCVALEPSSATLLALD